MIFKQFRYEPLSAASYLVGCARARVALVVDPIADLGSDFYVLEAADQGLDIVGVVETHLHADFVSCARELAELTGAKHYLGAAAEGLVRHEFTPVADGDSIRVGQIELQAIATPGHTPEHTAYLVVDHARADEPWAVLTGDSLFVGDVGRPDLLVGEAALDVMDEATRAETQFRSIHERLCTLPDHIEVFPNHYGGSTCGGVNMSGKASSTIYFEKRHNLALAQPDAAAFAAFVRETAKPFPDDYARIKSYNLGLIAREQFNRADLADRAELVLPKELPLVVHAEPEPIATTAITILREAGCDVRGHLAGGLAAWKAAGAPVAELSLRGYPLEKETVPT